RHAEYQYSRGNGGSHFRLARVRSESRRRQKRKIDGHANVEHRQTLTNHSFNDLTSSCLLSRQSRKRRTTSAPCRIWTPRGRIPCRQRRESKGRPRSASPAKSLLGNRVVIRSETFSVN